MPDNDDVKRSDLFRALLARQANNPTQGMSTYDRAMAGVGQGMTDAGLDAQQFLANGNPLGLPPQIMEQLRADLAARAKDKAATDAPLLNTTAGTAGSIAGQTAAMLPFR